MMFPIHSATTRPALDAVALHLLGEIVDAARAGRTTHLEELAAAVGVRKADCRRALSTLHQQGFVDVLRMRPSLSGFALGTAARSADLKQLRGLVQDTAEDGEPFGPPSERPPSMARRAA